MQQTILPTNQAVFRFQRNYSCSKNRECELSYSLCWTNWNVKQSSTWQQHTSQWCCVSWTGKITICRKCWLSMSLKCFMLPFLLYKWWKRLALRNFKMSYCLFDRKEDPFCFETLGWNGCHHDVYSLLLFQLGIFYWKCKPQWIWSSSALWLVLPRWCPNVCNSVQLFNLSCSPRTSQILKYSVLLFVFVDLMLPVHLGECSAFLPMFSCLPHITKEISLFYDSLALSSGSKSAWLEWGTKWAGRVTFGVVDTHFLVKFLLIGLVCLYDSKVW